MKNTWLTIMLRQPTGTKFLPQSSVWLVASDSGDDESSIARRLKGRAAVKVTPHIITLPPHHWLQTWNNMTFFCEMNGIYTSMVFRRNECCFHVRKAVVLETDSLFWARCWAAFLFHLLLCSFCCFTALFPETVLLLNLVCSLVPRVYFLLSLRAISERIGESPVCDLR